MEMMEWSNPDVMHPNNAPTKHKKGLGQIRERKFLAKMNSIHQHALTFALYNGGLICQFIILHGTL